MGQPRAPWGRQRLCHEEWEEDGDNEHKLFLSLTRMQGSFYARLPSHFILTTF